MWVNAHFELLHLKLLYLHINMLVSNCFWTLCTKWASSECALKVNSGLILTNRGQTIWRLVVWTEQENFDPVQKRGGVGMVIKLSAKLVPVSIYYGFHTKTHISLLSVLCFCHMNTCFGKNISFLFYFFGSKILVWHQHNIKSKWYLSLLWCGSL